MVCNNLSLLIVNLWDSWGNLLTILFLGVSENWNYIDWHIHMCACLDSEL